jgi:hypothetical protein
VGCPGCLSAPLPPPPPPPGRCRQPQCPLPACPAGWGPSSRLCCRRFRQPLPPGSEATARLLNYWRSRLRCGAGTARQQWLVPQQLRLRQDVFRRHQGGSPL